MLGVTTLIAELEGREEKDEKRNRAADSLIRQPRWKLENREGKVSNVDENPLNRKVRLEAKRNFSISMRKLPDPPPLPQQSRSLLN